MERGFEQEYKLPEKLVASGILALPNIDTQVIAQGANVGCRRVYICPVKHLYCPNGTPVEGTPISDQLAVDFSLDCQLPSDVEGCDVLTIMRIVPGELKPTLQVRAVGFMKDGEVLSGTPLMTLVEPASKQFSQLENDDENDFTRTRSSSLVAS